MFELKLEGMNQVARHQWRKMFQVEEPAVQTSRGSQDFGSLGEGRKNQYCCSGTEKGEQRMWVEAGERTGQNIRDLLFGVLFQSTRRNY